MIAVWLFYWKSVKNCPLSLKESALKNGGGRMNENFMKEKPVLPLILSMALPMVLSMLVNSLYNIVDSFLLHRSVTMR